MRNIASKVFTGLVLLLICGAAFADVDPSISSSAVTNHTDLSIAYLAQIFGTVNGSLHGTSGQMLGQLFYKLNIGILVVAGIWLAYTVITVLLKSTQEGSFMGANRNVAIVILKIVIGIGMLLPNPATGYSVFQDVVMKVTVEGVKLADQTWSYGLNYIDQGGSLWRSPGQTGGHARGVTGAQVISWSKAKDIMGPTDNTTTASGSPNWSKLGFSQKIFLNEVCMIASDTANQNSSSGNNNSSSDYNSSPPTKNYNVVVNNTTHEFQFPGVGNAPGLSNGNAPTCGSVQWTSISGGNGSTLHKQWAKNAVQEMVYGLLPAAKAYVCSQSGSGNNPNCAGGSYSSASDTAKQAFFSSLINFVEGVFPLAQSQTKSADGAAKGFIGTAKKQGWLVAGRYYWDLSQIQARYNQVSNIAHYVPKSITTAKGATNSALSNPTVANAVNNAASNAGGYVDGVHKLLSNYSNASGAGKTGAGYRGYTSKGSNIIIRIILGPIVSDVARLILLFAPGPSGMGSSPILFLHNVGMMSIAIAGDIWFGLVLGLVSIFATTIVCQATLNISTPMKEAADWIKVPMMILASALLGVGVILGYYLPLYPYMIFIFGVIGWLIAVIEAMVAAPLVCLGLTHPEGHDFLGEAKQALMLLLGVFLRPTLMIIGLIAGMILSYVTLRILVYTYSGFISDLFYVAVPIQGADKAPNVLLGAALAQVNYTAEQTGLDGLIMSLLTFPMFLVVFCGLVYVVTNQCFSLIYILPDNILRWIGGPANPSTAQQMAGEMRGVVSGTGSTAGSMVDKGVIRKSGLGDSSIKVADTPKPDEEDSPDSVEAEAG